MKYLGSSTIETDRLVLKAQTMDEQYYLWKELMIPEVNKYFLTVRTMTEALKEIINYLLTECDIKIMTT